MCASLRARGETQMHDAGLNRFTAWLIHKKAKGLIGEYGFTKSDLRDIEQDMTLDLLQRLQAFDPRRAQRHTFVVMIVDHRVAAIIEHRTAAMRDRRREVCSLNEDVYDDEGKTVERSETLDAERGRTWRELEEMRDLKADLGTVLEGLPPDLRSLALARQTKSWAEIAQERGVPRTSLYSDIRRLKAAVKRTELDQYLAEK